jgi:hypothetical protein
MPPMMLSLDAARECDQPFRERDRCSIALLFAANLDPERDGAPTGFVVSGVALAQLV